LKSARVQAVGQIDKASPFVQMATLWRGHGGPLNLRLWPSAGRSEDEGLNCVAGVPKNEDRVVVLRCRN
jgi:hypothetical protein